MSTVISLQIENGNSETIVVEDAKASQKFWNDYFTNSMFVEDDDYFFQSEIDLMGNPINHKLEELGRNKQ